MAAIVIYKQSIGDNGRREGMADFGEHLRVQLDNFAPNKPTLDEVKLMFRNAFRRFINDTDYQVRFESAVAGEERLFVLKAKINNNNRLKLDLSKDGTTFLRKVHLKITIDDLASAERKMHIVVPHESSGGAFDYLNDVVEDIDTLATSLDRATNYMISTTFFTRCA